MMPKLLDRVEHIKRLYRPVALTSLFHGISIH